MDYYLLLVSDEVIATVQAANLSITIILIVNINILLVFTSSPKPHS